MENIENVELGLISNPPQKRVKKMVIFGIVMAILAVVLILIVSLLPKTNEQNSSQRPQQNINKISFKNGTTEYEIYEHSVSLIKTTSFIKNNENKDNQPIAVLNSNFYLLNNIIFEINITGDMLPMSSLVVAYTNFVNEWKDGSVMDLTNYKPEILIKKGDIIYA